MRREAENKCAPIYCHTKEEEDEKKRREMSHWSVFGMKHFKFMC